MQVVRQFHGEDLLDSETFLRFCRAYCVGRSWGYCVMIPLVVFGLAPRNWRLKYSLTLAAH